MLEKTLHTGNIAAAFGTLATTAADLTVCGGAATTIGGLLSGIALFKSNTAAKSLTEQMGKAFKEAMELSPLSDDRKKLIPQIMQKYPVTEDIIAKGNMAPASVAAIIRTQVEARRETEDPALIHPAMLTAYEAILTQTLAPVLAQPTGMDPMHAAILKQLLERSDQTGAANKLRDEGITEKAIIRLAQRIAAETNDVGQAWLELQNAMDIAVRVQKEGAVGSNHQGFVDVVLKEVADLARDGAYAAASDAIDAALNQAEAEQLRLMDSGVEVALLDRNTKRAATLLIRKADIESGGHASVKALLELVNYHFQVGHKSGTTLDFALSLDIAADLVARALTPVDRSAVHNSMGRTLAVWGGRERGEAFLTRALSAFETALEDRDIQLAPIEWAATQMNIGNVMSSLGSIKNSEAHLQDALRAFSRTLQVYTKEDHPKDWAMATMNLGNAQFQIAAAMKDSQKLIEAIATYESTLDVRSIAETPLEWAMSKMNLANALAALGRLQNSLDYLKRAEKAYLETLLVRTKESTPVYWAGTQNNLADLQCALYRISNDPDYLEKGIQYATSARTVYDDVQATQYIAMNEKIIAELQALRDAHKP